MLATRSSVVLATGRNALVSRTPVARAGLRTALPVRCSASPNTSSPTAVAQSVAGAAALALVAVPAAFASDAAPQLIATVAEFGPSEAAATITFLRPVLTIGTLMMLARIVLTWYPTININEFPWNIVYYPTEPILGPSRKVIPPLSGVDISPVVWLGIISFLNEILIGPQGILNLIQRQGSVTIG